MQKKELILDSTDINHIIARVCHTILEVHKNPDNLALIGIRTGGEYLAQRIFNQIKVIENIELSLGNIDITLYRDDWTKIGYQPILQGTEINFAIDKKKIILVDDVLFTGRTVRAAMDAIFDIGRPDQIELAVLVDRGHRELPIRADYCGKKIETKHEQMINVYLKEHDGRDAVMIEG